MAISHLQLKSVSHSRLLNNRRAAPLLLPPASVRLGAQKRHVLAQATKTSQNAVEVSELELEQLRNELLKLRIENDSLKQELARLQAPTTATASSSKVTGTAASASTTTTSAAKVAVRTTTAPARPEAVKENLEKGILWPKPGEKFWERAPRESLLPLVDPNAPKESVPRDQKLLHIVHVAAEMAPIAKVGGLGDVVTGLAKACLERGHQVSVMLPFYECLPVKEIEGLKHEMDIDVPKGSTRDGILTISTLRTSVHWGKVDGVPTYLLRPADWNAVNIFRGTRIYGGSYNEAEAYLYFCRACLEFLKVSGQQPHILHVHEWQTCAVPLLYWELYNPAGLWRPRVVLTIHNMDNTGEVRQDEFGVSGYPGEAFATIDKALDERTIGHNPERLNLMKGGIVYSNVVTTVSPSYAREMLEGGAAGWLRGLLTRPEFTSKLVGILNGIDTSAWDPAVDPLLPANFTSDKMEGKQMCKRYLQKGLGLEEEPSKPLVAVISRLVPQKGIHLIKASIMRTLDQGGQFVLLGSGHSDPVFKAMANNELKDHPNARLLIMYNEALSHAIYAAADIMVVPSMFEPCGLTQMIAMRYGAIPLVRKTGGLGDTVKDVEEDKAAGNGFVFTGTDERSLHGALDRAIQKYKDQQSWNALMQRNMQADVAWRKSGAAYVNLYQSVAQN